MNKFTEVLLVACGIIAVAGWVPMLTAGALYAEFGWLKPVGFWPAAGIVFGVSIIVQSIRGKN